MSYSFLLSFEVSGEGIHDEQTGEFLGGMVALKDITEYTNKLAAQTEESEQQFEVICDTMPQMVRPPSSWHSPSVLTLCPALDYHSTRYA